MPRSRSLPSTSLILTAALSLAACDRAAPEPAAGKSPAAAPGQQAVETPSSPSAPGQAPSAEPKPSKPELAPNSFKPPTREQLAELERSLQAHLAAGRKAVKAKDYTTGIAELERALAINPLHAKTLGELGWAYFNAGRLDEARDRLERGLQYADNDGTRGAILYNLGRVAEAGDQTARAIELYASSLAVRPNDIVAERLAKLGGAAPSVDGQLTARTHGDCGFKPHGAPARNLCLAYLGGVESADPDGVRCEYGATAMRAEGEEGLPAGVASAESSDATVYDLKIADDVKVAVFSYLDYEMYDETFILAIVIADQLYTAPLAWVSHPGAGYADENLEAIDVRAEQLVPGGKPELVIEWAVGGHDMDPGVEMEELWSSKQIAVVSVDGGKPIWLAALTTVSERSYGPMQSWGDEPLERAADADSETETSREAVRVTWKSDTGKLEVVADGEPSAATGIFDLGAYPLLCPKELARF